MTTAAASDTERDPVTVRRGVIDLAFWETAAGSSSIKTDRTELRLIPELVNRYGPRKLKAMQYVAVDHG